MRFAPRGLAVLLLLHLLLLAWPTNAQTPWQARGVVPYTGFRLGDPAPQAPARRWAIVVNSTVNTAEATSTTGPRRHLLRQFDNLQDAMVRIVSGIPTVSETTGQPEFRVCVHIETNTAPGGPQLQVRFAAPGNGGTATSTTTVITRTGGVPCGSSVTDACGYTLNAAIDETCSVVGGGWCEACMRLVLPTGAPLATSLRVTFDLPLVFTALPVQAVVFPDPGIRFDGVLSVTLSAQTDPPKGLEFAPFLDAEAQPLTLWVTGACERTLAGVTSTSQLVSVMEVTQGDKMCIIAEAGGDEVANIEIVEVVGCLREGAPIATGERVVPSAVARESLCLGAAATTAMYGIFSTGTVQTAMNLASLKLYDEFSTYFPCSGGTGHVCKHGGGAEACPSGEVCLNGASNELYTRAIRDFGVPSALRPLVCWEDVALVTQRSAAVSCATQTMVAVPPCATPCRPLPTFVAIEVAVPVIEHDATVNVQYEVRVEWVPHFPRETASMRRRAHSDRSLLQEGDDSVANTTTATLFVGTRQSQKPGFIERVGSFAFVCAAGVGISAAVLYATRPMVTLAAAVA